MAETMDISRVTAIAVEERDKALQFAGCDDASLPLARASGLLPALHRVQEAFGHVDWRCIAPLADAFNISQAEVRGVISFYHDFRSEPAGTRMLKICRAEACQSMGCEALIESLRNRHAITPGETTPDGALSVEAVYCLGNCALAPAAMMDDDLIGRLDGAGLDRLIAGARR